MSEIERYSSEYYILADTDILAYSGDQIAVGPDLYEYLRSYVRSPMAKISGGHYAIEQEWGIPSETLAVPQSIDADPEDMDHVLVPENQRTFDLLMGGE